MRFFLLLVLSVFFLPLHAWSDLKDGKVKFVNITRQAGVDFIQVSGHPKQKDLIIEAKGGGVALLDADGDGWLDIYFINGNHTFKAKTPQPANKLYRNNGNGTFTDISDEAGVGDSRWSMGCAVGDYDNDGDIDFYVTNYGGNCLYRNDGTGRFEDVADEAGCQSTLMSTGVSFGDFDLDGFLDLVVADYLDLDSLNHLPPEERKSEWRGFKVYPGPRAYTAQGISLFRNKGDGTFENVTESSGLLSVPLAFSFTCLWADVNSDLYPDLYVANDSMPSYLFMNDGDGTFEETGLFAGVAYSEDGTEMASMGAMFGDADRDFKWDLAVTNFSEEPFSILLGDGEGFFEDHTYISGVGNLTYSSLGWGVQWIDVENDGDEDLIYSNGHVYPEADHPDLDISFAQKAQLFENDGNGKFVNVISGPGEDFYAPRTGRGCVSGDIDNDGDLDLVVNNLGNVPAILRNDCGNRNNWLQIVLEGTRNNRASIGASVKLTSGNLKAMKGVWSQSSFLSQNSLVLHFGLGTLDKAERLEVMWPSGTIVKLKDVPANQRIKIVEKTGEEKLRTD